MFSNIQEAFDYLYSFINFEKDSDKYINSYSLDNISKLMEYFNNPHFNKKIIHIAGTKGKGSTTFFISKMLNLAGYSVATFLSPHLIKPNERILFNLVEINDNEFLDIINKIAFIISKNNLKATTFELFFIIYLIYAENKKANYLVIETGLGGRLDCTNIVKPILSVITSISFDHTDILGSNIEDIATEKAFIIKERTKAVIAPQYYPFCNNIFKNRAKQINSDIFFTKRYFTVKNLKYKTNGITFDIIFKNIKEINLIFKNIEKICNIFLPLLGIHQIENFLTAFLSTFIIKPEIFGILNRIKSIDINIKGRIDVIKREPLIIVDVAHNSDSIDKLIKTIKSHFKSHKFIVLIGIAHNKDYKNIYNKIKNIATKIIITDLEYKKSNFKKNFEYTKRIFKNTILIEDQKEAINYALSLKENLIVVGSFYLAGPFLENYFKKL